MPHKNPQYHYKNILSISFGGYYQSTSSLQKNCIVSHFEIAERLYRIHQLIIQEHTGTPDELAHRMKISRRQLYYQLNELRDRGAMIKYDRIRRTFYYNSDFSITINRLHFSKNDT